MPLLLSVTCFGNSKYLGMLHDDLRSRRDSGSKSSDICIDKGLGTYVRLAAEVAAFAFGRIGRSSLKLATDINRAAFRS